jgi:hypothetical protein
MNALGLLVLLTALVPLLWGAGQAGGAAGNRVAAVMELPPAQADGFFDSGGVRIHYVEAGQGFCGGVDTWIHRQRRPTLGSKREYSRI